MKQIFTDGWSELQRRWRLLRPALKRYTEAEFGVKERMCQPETVYGFKHIEVAYTEIAGDTIDADGNVVYGKLDIRAEIDLMLMQVNYLVDGEIVDIRKLTDYDLSHFDEWFEFDGLTSYDDGFATYAWTGKRHRKQGDALFRVRITED